MQHLGGRGQGGWQGVCAGGDGGLEGVGGWQSDYVKRGSRIRRGRGLK